MRAVIPAAGLGTRFLPLSRAIPKELLPLGELPVIHHALREAERAGFEQAIIVISPVKRAIRTYFEAAPDLEQELERAGNREGLSRLHEAQAIARRLEVIFIEAWTRGPGQAVLLSHSATGDDSFAVLLPDDVVPGVEHWRRMLSLWQETGAPVMTVRRFDPSTASRFGIAVCDTPTPTLPLRGREIAGALRVRDLVEKPPPGRVQSELRIFGRYIVTRPVLEALEERFETTTGELQLTEGYAAALDDPGVLGVEFSAEYFDCGTPADFAESTARYASTPHPDPPPQGGREIARLVGVG
jgi:UTP--glucose-1-phosphate uridylyltransferase